MTIKEMEVLAGMTRANIRFYEAEGMLKPKRRENGYRIYSEADLDTLKKIRLLRALRFSLEEIKGLQMGELSMDSALAQHLEDLQRDGTEVERDCEICLSMRGDKAQYQTLDAQRYLTALEEKGYHPAPEPELNAEPRVYGILRRFFARGLDATFYQVLWNVFLISVLNKNLGSRTTPQIFLDLMMPILLMLLLEPVLLHLFGATLGKALLGLRVKDRQGRKLTYGGALYRTLTVLVLGLGLNFPFFHLYRLWKSFVDASEKRSLEWEVASQVIRKDGRRWWQIPAYICACVVLIGAMLSSASMAEMPKYRGDITVAQFSENFNRLFHYTYDNLGAEVPVTLDQEGRWTVNTKPSWHFWGEVYPELEYSVADGVMTGLRFSAQGNEGELPLCDATRVLFVQSLIGAKTGQARYPEEVEDLVKLIKAHPEQSFTRDIAGFTIIWEVTYAGYSGIPSSGVLLPEEGEEHSYHIFFSIEKQET